MNKIIYLTLLTVVMLMTCSCNSTTGQDHKVLIKTPYGEMKVKLYNETPKHRDNFMKLVNEKFYDSLIFHRVIEGFMIQGGDPDSKNAPASKQLGAGSVPYKIDAEFTPERFHKKGALAAARDNNPKKQSSGCQFYIVQGKPYSDAELDQMEEQMKMSVKKTLFSALISNPDHKEIRETYDSLMRTQDREGFEKFILETIEPLMEQELAKLGKEVGFSAEARNAYKTIGGTPFLDNEYTVFGEVYEGLEVIDAIAAVKTASGDRPLENVIMEITVIK